MAWSLRIASLVAPSGQIAGDLPGNISPHVVIPQDHFEGPMASEAPNVAEIAASIEGHAGP